MPYAIDFSSVRLAVTGTGRVSRGAEEIAGAAGFEEVSPSSYTSSEHNGNTLCCQQNPCLRMMNSSNVFLCGPKRLSKHVITLSPIDKFD